MNQQGPSSENKDLAERVARLEEKMNKLNTFIVALGDILSNIVKVSQNAQATGYTNS